MKKLTGATIISLVRADGTIIYFPPDTIFYSPETDDEIARRIYKTVSDTETTFFFSPLSYTFVKAEGSIPDLPEEAEIPEVDR